MSYELLLHRPLLVITAKVDSSENIFLNLEELETETVSVDVISPSENHQDVEISSGDEEANVVTNFENESLSYSEFIYLFSIYLSLTNFI